MLYGVRRDLQEQLVREGYGVRVYVPFGTQWYPYLMRRLAERPANVAFITGNIVREMFRPAETGSVMAARFVPPDHSKGDEATIGGYAAVHDRPAAFEGSDGFSYSVEIMAEETTGARDRWSALSSCSSSGRAWARKRPRGISRASICSAARPRREARERLGLSRLDEVKALLDRLIAARTAHGSDTALVGCHARRVRLRDRDRAGATASVLRGTGGVWQVRTDRRRDGRRLAARPLKK